VSAVPKATLDRVGLHYQQLGKAGPDVVLVHGLGANLAFWALGAAPLLARTARVTAYDLRGHGYSDMPPRGYSFVDMAEDLRCLLDALEVESAHLVGHSFGTGAVLEFAARNPERTRSMVLADPIVASLHRGAGRRMQADPVQEVSRWLAELGIVADGDGLDNEHRLLERVADPRVAGLRSANAASGFLVPFGLWNGGRRSAAIWRRLLNTTTALEEFAADATLTADRLKTVAQPTLITLGSLSRHLATRAALERYLPAARTAIVPGAGHFHPLLRPNQFAAHVGRFIAKNGSGQGST
jgi:pimeloyl-ACP methyl ester carboxylesterase